MAPLFSLGFGLPPQGETVSDMTQQVSQDGGRWFLGYGYVMRGRTGINGPSAHISLAATKTLGERAWVRVRLFPTAEEEIWHQFDTTHGAESVWSLTLDQTGILRAYHGFGAGDQLLLGVVQTLALNVYTKLVIISQYQVGPTDKLSVNGISFSILMFSNGNIQYSKFGSAGIGGTTPHGAWIDVTDWVGNSTAADPGDSFVATMQPIANGLVSPPAGGVSYINLSQIPPPGDDTADVTIADGASVSLSFAAIGPLFPGATIKSLNLGAYITSAFLGNVQLNLWQGGSQVFASGDFVTGSAVYVRQFVAGSGGLATGTPFELQLVNHTGGALTFANLALSAEIAGAAIPANPFTTDTNAYGMSGTYAGNNVGQLIKALGPAPGNTPFTPVFGFICPVSTNDNGGILFWQSMIASHNRLAQKILADKMPYFRLGTPLTSFAPSGPNDQVNQNGTTYQFVILGDPTGRTLRTGAASTKAVVDPAVQTIALTSFPAVAVWAMRELYARSNVTGSHVRGPGHSGLNSSPLDAAQVTTAIESLGASSMTWGSTLTDDSPGSAYVAFRTDAFCSLRLFAWTSYTGDGNPPRVIPLSLSGRVPMFEIVIPANGQSYFRLPGFPAGNARPATGGPLTGTAITAVGPNSITVGATLNALNVVYSVFAIAGPSTLQEMFGSVLDTCIVPPVVGAGCVEGSSVVPAGGVGAGCSEPASVVPAGG